MKVYKAEQLVDPGHPAASIRKALFPNVRRDDLGIKMMPTGLLLREKRQFPAIPILSWRERVEMAKEGGLTARHLQNNINLRGTIFKPGEQLYPKYDYNNVLLPTQKITPCSPVLDVLLKKTWRRVPMAFHISTSKARMGSFRHQRKHIEKRLRAAINLIVTRGAYFDREADKIGINMEDSGRKWVMQGWTYMFLPSTKIHQMPYTELIDLLRTLLAHINSQAMTMEKKWLYDSLVAEELGSRLNRTGERTKSLSSSAVSDVHLTGLLQDDSMHPDLVEKVGLVNLQKSRAQKRDSAPELITSDRKEEQHGLSNVSTEALPSRILAGKTPAVWKQELISSLSLLVGQKHNSSHEK
ncbi:hypothetical protein JR316_0013055 [Psilocybe cubensis]|nr:hypothetical protein JR316_0013055 [Psilocybe cubensis]KAH9474593.1 hypothetical protein JR316_0013055 [Psilocybe cubensis]